MCPIRYSLITLYYLMCQIRYGLMCADNILQKHKQMCLVRDPTPENACSFIFYFFLPWKLFFVEFVNGFESKLFDGERCCTEMFNYGCYCKPVLHASQHFERIAAL